MGCILLFYHLTGVLKLSQHSSTVCIQKWYTKKIIILDMKFVQKVCVFGTMSKRNNCTLNNIICFVRVSVLPRFVRGGKISFVPLFVFIVEIVVENTSRKSIEGYFLET